MAKCKSGNPDIVQKENMDRCYYQCRFEYYYGLANIRVTPKSKCLEIEYNTQNKDSPVIFNEQKYSVSRILISAPSVHRFNTSKSKNSEDIKTLDAEMIIEHTLCEPGSTISSNCPPSLYICIPVSSNASTGSNTSLIIDQIIQHGTMLNMNQHSDVLTFDSPFNLNEFIPDELYFSYTGQNLEGIKTKNCANYIVYSKPIGVSSSRIKQLSSKVNSSGLSKSNTLIDLFYSTGKATLLHGSSKKDDIYIDCQPTDDSGELLFKENKGTPQINTVSSDNTMETASEVYKTFWKIFYQMLDIIMGILITMLVVMAAKGLIDGKILSISFWMKLLAIGFIVGMLSMVKAGKKSGKDFSIKSYMGGK